MDKAKNTQMPATDCPAPPQLMKDSTLTHSKPPISAGARGLVGAPFSAGLLKRPLLMALFLVACIVQTPAQVGALWVSGDNSFGQLGDGTTVSIELPLLLRSNVLTVATGAKHTLFVKTDNTLWGMGACDSGQLGVSSTNNQLTPILIASNVVSVSAGEKHSMFLKMDGSLWGVGDNRYGQIGDGTTNNRYAAVQIATNVRSVAAGSFHTLIIKNDNSLLGTGLNDFGQLGLADKANRLTPVVIDSGVANGVHDMR